MAAKKKTVRKQAKRAAATGGKWERDLGRNAANHEPLSPVGFLARAAAVWPKKTAILHGRIARTWAQTHARCRRLASALARAGIRRGDTVALMAPNIPEA